MLKKAGGLENRVFNVVSGIGLLVLFSRRDSGVKRRDSVKLSVYVGYGGDWTSLDPRRRPTRDDRLPCIGLVQLAVAPPVIIRLACWAHRPNICKSAR